MKILKRLFLALFILGSTSIHTGCVRGVRITQPPMKRSVMQQYGPPTTTYRMENGHETWIYRIPVLTAEQYQELAAEDEKIAREQRVPLDVVKKRSTTYYEFEIEFDRHGNIFQWRREQPGQLGNRQPPTVIHSSKSLR